MASRPRRSCTKIARARDVVGALSLSEPRQTRIRMGMRKTVLPLAMVMLVVGFSTNFGRAQTPPRAVLVTEKIKDDLYVIIGNGGNVAFLVTDEGVVLI